MTTSSCPAVGAHKIPWLTVEQMVEADGLAVEEFNIDLLQMMEYAGANIAPPSAISILAEGGNNGGSGLSAARHAGSHRYIAVSNAIKNGAQ